MKNDVALYPINHLSLCAGAGGIDLGLRLALGERCRTVCYVERESYAAAILVARMESAAVDWAPIWDDLTTFSGKPWRGLVDLISAGFPCPPVSFAGRRLGTEDPRWLWPHIVRIVREVRPKWVFLENVRGLLSANEGKAFESILSDLATLGFNAEWDLFSAASVGATHKRERVFILAHAGHNARGTLLRDKQKDRAGISRRDGETNQPRLADSPSRGLGELRKPSRTRRQSDRRNQQLGYSAKSRLAIARRIGTALAQHRAKSQSQRSSESDLADARHGQLSQSRGRSTRRARSRSASAIESVANAQRERLQRRPRVRSEKFSRLGQSSRIPLSPPGPDQRDRWKTVLEVSPALEPAVCGMANELAYRMDRLRLCGNGVYPLAAAVAFYILATRAGILIDV